MEDSANSLPNQAHQFVLLNGGAEKVFVLNQDDLHPQSSKRSCTLRGCEEGRQVPLMCQDEGVDDAHVRHLRGAIMTSLEIVVRGEQMLRVRSCTRLAVSP